MKVAIGPSSFAEEDDAPLRALEAAGVEVRPNPFSRRLNEAEIIEQLDGMDGLIAGLEPLNRKVLTASPQLKALARVGIGVNNVDFAAAAECNIKVSSTPDPPAKAVAELTVAALLSILRKLPQMNAALHAGQWKKNIGLSLVGTAVLLVGFGRIGRRVAQLLQAFDAHVYFFDPQLPESAEPHGAIRVQSLTEGLELAQIISLHAGGADKILDAEAFAKMRNGAIILNSARGELIDEPALVAALESGKVAAGWCDAFEQEPYSGPLTKFDQMLLTPHAATYTRQCRLDMEMQAVANLLRDLGLIL